MAKETLYLIDATAFCYRAFYGVRGLSTSFGQPTNAIFGFLNILQRVLKELSPRYLGVCFDVSRATFRQQKFAQYKMQRPATPEELSSQFPLIRQITAAYGLPIFEKEGYEADDVIATLARQAKSFDMPVVIISADKDMLQLVDETTTVRAPAKNGDVIYDCQAVTERYGVGPCKVTDIVALTGDSIDNIPGVPGVGEKTAMKLLQEFGGLDSLMANVERVKQEKVRLSLINSRQQIAVNKELAVLDSNVPVDISLDALKLRSPDYKELFRLFKYLEFKSFIKTIPVVASSFDVAARAVSDSQVEDLLGNAPVVYIAGTSSGDLALSGDGESFSVQAPGPRVAHVLGSAAFPKAGHDLKKLRSSIMRDGFTLRGLKFDTMIAAYVLNPTRGSYELSQIAADNLDEPVAVDAGPAAAVRVIRELAPILKEKLARDSLLKLFEDVEMPLVEVLADMEAAGISLDIAVIGKLSGDVEQRRVRLIDEIYDASGCRFNINSPKQLRDVLFDKLKLPVMKRTKTGPSTDEEVLHALSQQHALPALLLEYRHLTKLKNTYIDTLPALIDPVSNRIHTSFNQTGTETGRLSSSNPNLQNIPIKTDIGRTIRRAIISSDPSRYLLSCDYSQIELRILAHLSKDRELIAAFAGNKDIHKATAALVYGIDEKDVTDVMRDAAKRVNFGIIYGLTAFGLSRDLKIPVEESQSFIEAYFTRYPGVKAYIHAQIARAEADGYVTTLLGRRRALPQINDKNQGIRQFAQRQAVNTPVQGSAADLIKLAMLAIHREFARLNLQSRMILQVHDELVFDVAAQEMEQVCALVKDLMEHVLGLDVPVKVDMKKGRNWLEMEAV